MSGRLYRSNHAHRTASASRPEPPPGPPGAPPPGPPGGPPPPAAETGGGDAQTGDSHTGDSYDEELGSAAGHSAVMAIGSLVSRGTGFLRVVIIAAALGSTLVGDSYTTAQYFPGMVYELLLGGILTSVLVPVLVRARKADPDRGEAFTQRLVTLAVVALGVTTALAVAGAPLLAWLVADPEQQPLVTTLSYLILPTIFFYGMAGLLTAVLNTRGHFAAPMWAPILNNLVVIGTFALYLLIYGAEPIAPAQMDAGRIALIGGGTLLGIVVQAVGLWPALRRVGFRFRFRFGFRALGLGELGRLGGWMFCYVAVNQVGVVVMMTLLNRAAAEPGNAGLLIFNNVFLLMMMAHGIVAVSIIMALMPRLSAAAADGRREDMLADLGKGARMMSAVLAPIAAAYAVLALPISATLFQFGAFDAAAAREMAPVLLIAGAALIPFSLSQLTTFAFYAMPDTRTPALVNIGVVALRIGVQVGVFVAFSASVVAAGMMLGNAVSYLVAVFAMGYLLRRRLGPLGLRRVTVSLVKIVVAAIAAGGVGWLVVWAVPGGAEPGKLLAAGQLAAGGLALCLTYLGLALLLRISEVTEVVGLVRRKLLPSRS
ncbi:murein biosynthesis integral membrane protein MurJ [Natronosporangium hydrolyticum]|uniref:Murein biosynthesis integral membrane protein MurJ n=1 Tax=Natronosporangium hydrolyticum TaxID=2811111 RepID=A0A895YH17_9ACTN|nr:murein biosynthesis integral membrane protein MurJ [Natronosporangium hydrolyticum]QSB14809.1 murein biosynthesis integral membrane protein MurJ [Natronosporangium hydrolyticum]